MKTRKIIILLLGLIMAVDAFGQFKSGENVVISKKVNQDLYVAGGTVTINAPIEGDLVLTGGTVTVNDTVTQDILVAGGNIILNGYVGDDIRCAGGSVNVSGPVTGDLIAAGGTINISKEVVITGGLLLTGGEVTLDGTVEGPVKTASGTFALNGVIHNDLECRGGKVLINGEVDGKAVLAANIITLGTGALFNKDVRYWSKEGNLDFAGALGNSKATFDPSLEMESGSWHYLGFASLLMVLWYLGAALIMITLLQYLFDKIMKKAADSVKLTSLKSLGIGFLFLLGMPIAIVLSMVTIIGVPVGILMLLGYITILLLGTGDSGVSHLPLDQ